MTEQENKLCEVCKTKKASVRFEGLTENFICDSCLFDYKENKTE